MNIREVFDEYFERYNQEVGRHIYVVITSGDRQGDPTTNPHALPENAQDITLRVYGDYAPIGAYNHLMEWLMENWPYRAGVDNTEGNVHIHLDLGQVKPEGQELPFFFLEDNGKFIRQIHSGDLA